MPEFRIGFMIDKMYSVLIESENSIEAVAKSQRMSSIEVSNIGDLEEVTMAVICPIDQTGEIDHNNKGAFEDELE